VVLPATRPRCGSRISRSTTRTRRRSSCGPAWRSPAATAPTIPRAPRQWTCARRSTRPSARL